MSAPAAPDHVLPFLWPTDSRGVAPQRGVGIDDITLVGPTSSALLFELSNQGNKRSLDRSTGEVRDTDDWGSGTFKVGLVNVRVQARSNRGPAVQIDINVPKAIYGHNCVTWCPGLLAEAVDALLADLGRQLPDVPDVGQVHLTRLDAVRDFYGVQSPSTTLEHIGQHSVAPAKMDDHYYDPSTGLLQTLERGSKTQWVARGYDKHHRTHTTAIREGDADRKTLLRSWADAVPEHFRFEGQVRRDLLRRRGIRSIMEATPEAVEAVCRELFEKGRFDVITGGSTVLVHRLQQLREAGVPAKDRRALNLYLVWQLTGEFPANRKIFETGRALARRHGLTGASFVDGWEPHRLDFDAGTELVGEEALRFGPGRTPPVFGAAG